MSKVKIITMVKKMADENMKVAIDREEFMDYSVSVMTQTRMRESRLYKAAFLKVLRDEFGFGKSRLVRISELVDILYSDMDDSSEKFKEIAKELNDICGTNVIAGNFGKSVVDKNN